MDFAFVMVESRGVPFPGETALISAAIYVGATHDLRIWWVIAVAAAGAVVWAAVYGVAYYEFGSLLERVNTTIDVAIGVDAAAILVGFLIWLERRQSELEDRADRELQESLAQELGLEGRSAGPA